jgi:hypothetical protein
VLTLVTSYLPLLLLPLPLSLSPVHLILLLLLTYILNRPCIYCSFLLIILFASSCHWSSRCFFDLPPCGNDDAASTIAAWFTPRLYTTASLGQATQSNGTTTDEMNGFLADIAQATIAGLTNAMKESAAEMFDEVKERIVTSTATSVTAPTGLAAASSSVADSGIGVHWLRHLLGLSEWTLPCVGVKLVL